jgi:hypothetical protein
MKSNKQVWGIVCIVFGVLILSGVAVRLTHPLDQLGSKTAEMFDQIGNNVPNFDFDGQNSLTDRGQQTFDASKITKLELNEKAGKINITTDPNAKVAQVNYVKGIGLKFNNTDLSERLKNVEVKLQTMGDTQHVDVEYHGNNDFFNSAYVNLDIVIPPNLQVDVRSNAGEVTTNGLQNKVSVHLNAGKIQVDGFTDTADLHNNAGEIRVSGGQQIKRIDAEVNMGAVHVSLPQQASLAIDASTNVGNVTSDFPLNVTKHIPGSSAHGSIGTGKDGLVTLRNNTGEISISQE